MTTAFKSEFRHIGPLGIPDFKGTRVMMMPIVLGEEETIPEFLSEWKPTLLTMAGMASDQAGKVGYITIDEKEVGEGTTHRRSGLHVDGVYRGRGGSWGGGGGWGSNGMITVSSHAGCRAWNKEFVGTPGDEGECDHLVGQCADEEATVFEPYHAYWLSGLCVHESMPMQELVRRQFVRLSMPSNSPWFQGYTENPLGIMPTGPILPPREFMNV